MKISDSLELFFEEMEVKKTQEIASFLDELPLNIEDCGFPGDNRLIIQRYECNDAIFSLTPVEKRIGIEEFEKLSKRRYKTSFNKIGREETSFVDQFYVGFRKSPYTGIFLRTGPLIGSVNSSD